MISVEFTHISPEELSTWLSDLIKIDTTNPPGNEIKVVDYIRDLLDNEGIAYQILAKDKTRANIFIHLPGTSGSCKLLLSGHLDVVPAEKDSWQVPPFSGNTINDEIWGRGALDCKGLVVMILAVLIEIHRSDIVLRHDLNALFLADEEVQGEYGAKYITDTYPELLQTDYLINEAGGMLIEQNGKKLFLLNNAEKGSFAGEIFVKGRPGHGSIPKTADNSLKYSSIIVQRLLSHQTEITASEEVLDQIELMGGGKLGRFIFSQPFLARFFLNHPVGPLKEITPIIDAMLRPTITPTMISGSDKINVIPGASRIGIDCRLLPGQDWQTVEDELARALHGLDYTLIQLFPETVSGTASSIDPDFNQAIQKTLDDFYPDTTIVPYLTMGATDMRYFRTSFGIPSYGIMPLIIDDIDEFSEMFHGRDERIHKNNLEFGAKFLYLLISNLSIIE